MPPSPTRGTERATHAAEPDLGLERLVFFSDAVIAIAITLLVIELHVPEIAPGRAVEELPGRLLELAPQMRSFVISFLVIGLQWFAHHRMFRAIVRYDRRLLWINLLFLLGVAFLPFPTALLGRYGDTQIAVLFYALSVIAVTLMKLWLWWYATSAHRLVERSLSKHAIRRELWRNVDTLIVFPVSIAISFVSPSLAIYSWLLLVPVSWAARRLSASTGWPK